MNARLRYADGQKAEDLTLDDRVLRYPVFDDGAVRWFHRTGEVEDDGFTVFREMNDAAPDLCAD